MCGGVRIIVAGSLPKTLCNDRIYKYLCIYLYIYYVGKSIQPSYNLGKWEQKQNDFILYSYNITIIINKNIILYT